MLPEHCSQRQYLPKLVCLKGCCLLKLYRLAQVGAQQLMLSIFAPRLDSCMRSRNWLIYILYRSVMFNWLCVFRASSGDDNTQSYPSVLCFGNEGAYGESVRKDSAVYICRIYCIWAFVRRILFSISIIRVGLLLQLVNFRVNLW